MSVMRELVHAHPHIHCHNPNPSSTTYKSVCSSGGAFVGSCLTKPGILRLLLDVLGLSVGVTLCL